MHPSAKEMVKEMLLTHSPPEAAISQVEFEGPRLAIYTRNPAFIFEGTGFAHELAKAIRKRIVLRISPSARLDEKAEDKGDRAAGGWAEGHALRPGAGRGAPHDGHARNG